MSIYSVPLVQLTPSGLYCEAGDFYIDPKRAVETAIVTHAHSDHARRGSRRYICESSGVGLLKVRLGRNIQIESHPFREVFELGRTRVSFHSAGHILGSSQVRIECDGEIWICSGDYKRDSDPSCEPFEVVTGDVLITEATFGTPKYRWDPDAQHGHDIWDWWKKNQDLGLNSILFGYSLGKAQRILAELYPFAEKPVLIHSSIAELTECYRAEGRNLAKTKVIDELLSESTPNFEGEMILAPPSILNDDFKRYLGEYRTAFASGWMQGSSSYGRGSTYDHGFVMSDHADWDSLNRTIRESRAKRVFVQHRNGTLIRHLRKQGIDAHPEEALTLDNFARLGGQEMSLFENR